jgi:RNA polymerase sigma-70 factor (ECF subfamily)
MLAATEAMEASVEVERLFEEHHRTVFLTAYRVTGNASDAEDVLQTVFLRVLRRAAEAEPMANPESYLRRAALNAALDLMRSRQTASSVPLEDLEFALASGPALAPDRGLARGEIRQWLRGMVARLSPRAAEIFALRFYEGMGTPEIARTLGMTEGTVAVTLSRARGRIEKEYQAYIGGRNAPRE